MILKAESLIAAATISGKRCRFRVQPEGNVIKYPKIGAAQAPVSGGAARRDGAADGAR